MNYYRISKSRTDIWTPLFNYKAQGRPFRISKAPCYCYSSLSSAMAQTIAKILFLIKRNGRFAVQKLLVTDILVLTRGWIIFFPSWFVFVAKRTRYIVFGSLGDISLLCYDEHNCFLLQKRCRKFCLLSPLPTPCELTKFLLFCASIRGHKTNINT